MPILFFLLAIALHADETCSDWFRAGKIKKGSDCTFECSILMVDMATFRCPEQCHKLCEDIAYTPVIFALYPGLTAAEKELIKKDPKTLYNAYELAREAERICTKTYGVSDINDISDACRHYIWSSKLRQNIGKEAAKQILDAHEKNETQPEDQYIMDTHNNTVGLQDGAKKMSDLELIKKFKQNIQRGKMHVIKK